MFFSVRSETIQICLLLPFLYNIVLEVPASAIGQDKQIRAGEEKKLKLYINRKYNCLWRKSDDIYKNNKTRLLKLNEFSKAAGYEIITQISMLFLYTSNEQSKIEFWKVYKNKDYEILRDKYDKRSERPVHWTV